ncbi:MAG TPA: amidase [Caulobacteraceae bacterium]|jgi:Asp-tRNA(Asn)/Glu-tRNA(Gln) amidotransferase A subunit family amidase|nr:amidase [Caulobacteraceae bacterium]
MAITEQDYLAHDAMGLAMAIAGGQFSAVEALEAAAARTAQVNPKVNAITLDLTARARRELAERAPSGPLAGVPFLLKDLGPRLAGTATTASSKLYADEAAEEDSPLTQLYKAAGLVIFGKTNTPELGLEPVTEPAMFGPTRNPWDLGRTAGGSSGGAAAAVAAGIVPAAHASDGGGSIRIPASCCGLFGLKPSRALVSSAPGDEGWGGFSCGHVVSRSVRDSALLLDIAAHPQPGDPYWTAPPAEPFLAAAERDPTSLRVAFTTAAFSAAGIEPECAEAVRAAAKLCENLGHRVEEADPPIDRASLAAAGVVISASIAADLDTVALKRGRPIAEDEVEPITWTSYQRGRTISGSAYIQALRGAHALGRAVARFFQRHDILICSTLGSPAIPVGYLQGEPLDLDGYAGRLFAFMPNTQAFNVTGQPAASVPLAMSSGGLPIGVQFVARQAEDALLLSLCGQLERAAPWSGRRAKL